jgi:predicted ATPase
MRLEKFWVKEYRVLKDIEINFLESSFQKKYALDFFAGVNGTGKSSVLRLIAKIFVALKSDTSPGFPSEIELDSVIQEDIEKSIKVKISSKEDDKLKYLIDEEDQSNTKLSNEYLPSKIIIYTTGRKDLWAEEVLKMGNSPEDKEELLDGQSDLITEYAPIETIRKKEFEKSQISDLIKKGIVFINEEHLSLVTLCGLLANLTCGEIDKKGFEKVLRELFIQDMTAFSLRLRPQNSNSFDQQIVIEKLKKLSVIQSMVEGDDLLLFDPNIIFEEIEEGKKVVKEFGSVIDFFEALLNLTHSLGMNKPPLVKVSIYLQRDFCFKKQEEEQSKGDTSNQEIQLLDRLSDGEQSFLARMCLFGLFRTQQEMLILLDEPEVHFNDVWKREIVNIIDEMMQNTYSHIIISTHSSIALTDVPRNSIVKFTRDGRYLTGKQAITTPSIQTFGADPTDIMVHVFGTNFGNGTYSTNEIRKRISDCESDKQFDELEEIIAPGYWQYRLFLEKEEVLGKNK